MITLLILRVTSCPVSGSDLGGIDTETTRSQRLLLETQFETQLLLFLVSTVKLFESIKSLVIETYICSNVVNSGCHDPREISAWTLPHGKVMHTHQSEVLSPPLQDAVRAMVCCVFLKVM